jgi:hypothetical protein
MRETAEKTKCCFAENVIRSSFLVLFSGPNFPVSVTLNEMFEV